METISLVALILAIASPALTYVAKKLQEAEVRRKTLNRQGPAEPTPPTSGRNVLIIFTAIFVALGAFTLFRYWEHVIRNQDLLIFGAWLFIVMVIGMFVQVIVSNYRAGNPLFKVSGSQLIFPVLLSPIVFYAVWATAAAAPRSYFVIYCAFINGYFWESIVSRVNPPNDPSSQQQG